MRAVLIILLFNLISPVIGQIESSSNIVFDDSLSSNRIFSGLGTSLQSTDGINAGEYISGKNLYSIAIGTDSIQLNIPYLTTPLDGTFLNFKSSGINKGAMKITLNGINYFNLYKQNGDQIDSAEIQPGQIISTIFDGNNFICISKLYKPCKKGFVSVSDTYCIDALPRGSSNFYNSVQTCGNEGAMLCTWNQWYFACTDSLNNGSGGYLSNFEWVNDAGNNGSDAKVAGFENEAVYAGYGCKKSYSLPATMTSFTSPLVTSGATIPIRFRCCYKK